MLVKISYPDYYFDFETDASEDSLLKIAKETRERLGSPREEVLLRSLRANGFSANELEHPIHPDLFLDEHWNLKTFPINEEGKQKALAFLEDNKELFLGWLVRNFDEFPYVCQDASLILLPYLKAHFGVGDCVKGSYSDDEENFSFHCWMDIEGETIDFTFSQFHPQKLDLLNRDKRTNEDLYESLVRSKYGSYHIQDEELKKRFFECFREEVEVSDWIKKVSFRKYLKEMLKNVE